MKKRLDELEDELDHREDDIRKKLETRYAKKFEELQARIELEAGNANVTSLPCLS